MNRSEEERTPSTQGTPRESALPTRCVLGTPLALTTYRDLTQFCTRLATASRPYVVDFSNTMIVTLRRHEPAFRTLTRQVDYFVPDGMPLIWCLNAQGSRLRDRVYGPSFMAHALRQAPNSVRHFFLGASEECLEKLEENARRQTPHLNIVGKRNGYFTPAEEPSVVEEINRLAPDFIWVGLGTPKQQAWIDRWRTQVRRGVIFAVGYAFDVNAGTKPDAPPWMQRLGLTWLFRLATEPRRLFGRYLKYNSLFLWYLLWDGIRGRAFASGQVPGQTRE